MNQGQDFAQSELKCLVAAMIGRLNFTLARKDEDGQYTPAGVVTTKAAKVNLLLQSRAYIFDLLHQI